MLRRPRRRPWSRRTRRHQRDRNERPSAPPAFGGAFVVSIPGDSVAYFPGVMLQEFPEHASEMLDVLVFGALVGDDEAYAGGKRCGVGLVTSALQSPHHLRLRLLVGYLEIGRADKRAQEDEFRTDRVEESQAIAGP